MKTKLQLAAFALLSSFLFHPSSLLHATTTITTTNHHAYGANLGWVEARGDAANGAVIGEYVCSGSLYAANAGWISLGGGTPANGIRYQNNSGTDCGVNHDGLGNLRGYAWGANIGWISLSNAQAMVQTAYLAPGADTDGDGMADAWERTYTNTLTAFTAGSDTDGDGHTDAQEHLADTNPLDPGDHLRITSITHGQPTPDYTTLQWASRPTRFYAVERRESLSPTNAWGTLSTLPWLGINNAGFDQTGSQNFYRVRAVRPLSP